jgi:guanyl-specific ribonuclease Sa
LKSRGGGQPELDQRLELHQTLETLLVFDVPNEARGLKALIEEGPPFTLLLLPDDREVFSL